MLRVNRRASDGEWLAHPAEPAIEAGCTIQLAHLIGPRINGDGDARSPPAGERPSSLCVAVTTGQQVLQQATQRKAARSGGATARERAEYKLTVLCVGMIMLFLMGTLLASTGVRRVTGKPLYRNSIQIDTFNKTIKNPKRHGGRPPSVRDPWQMVVCRN